jgi:hypothetical protein
VEVSSKLKAQSSKNGKMKITDYGLSRKREKLARL